ncbi:uncharacterized protein MONOS_17462 [Monocercomonoides exilis]|uniref:uncharacterized protein n=1 Tax=Monocercomonoides exilis TaxID=2049356 RepID=UPI00355A6FF8|nr:hypothetical protein MONOS_17462 [Monocercomonoides exilis]
MQVYEEEKEEEEEDDDDDEEEKKEKAKEREETMAEVEWIGETNEDEAYGCVGVVECVLQQRVRAHGGAKAEGRVLEADWRDRMNVSQDAEKEMLLEFLEWKNL